MKRWLLDVLSFLLALGWLLLVRRVYQPVYILALWYRIRMQEAAVNPGK